VEKLGVAMAVAMVRTVCDGEFYEPEMLQSAGLLAMGALKFGLCRR
jgi:hypothetical protein